MSDDLKKYWHVRLQNCAQALEQNGFEAFCADNAEDARNRITNDILPRIQFESVSWGDSLTLYATGILEAVKQGSGVRVIDPFETGVARADIIERRRQALLTDLFFSGTNAITENGVLVNLDMIGNRIGGIAFGGCALGLLLAMGGLAIGGVAFGGGAVGFVAVGGGAAGYYACGGGAVGEHVLTAMEQDPEAVRFFQQWVPDAMLPSAVRPD